MKQHWRDILRHEFEAGEGTFLIRLRSDLIWDRAAFSRLVQAMQQCAAEHENCEKMERWIAQGFWYVEGFARDWSSHENFPRDFEARYVEAAHARLCDLSYWLFMGESPYLPDHVWEDV
jgi:hypothetical protein